MNKLSAANKGFASGGVTFILEASFFDSSSAQVGSIVLQTRPKANPGKVNYMTDY